MAAETLAPDALTSSTGFTSCALSDLTSDPDSGDGNWCVASSNNVSDETYVTFGSPTGNPTVGADLQEFKAEVRKFDGGQTGTPTARIELWENGSLVRAGSETNVTSATTQVISFLWNANELGTADGSLVECKVFGTKSGGSPGARNTVDVGGIEWNVDYTIGSVTYYESHTANSTGTASVVTAAEYPLTLSSTSTGTADVTKTVGKPLSVSGVGTADVVKGIGLSLDASAVGTVSESQGLLYSVTIEAAGVATVSMVQETIVGILSDTSATGTPTVQKTVKKSLEITTNNLPSLQKLISISRVISSLGTADLTHSIIFSRNFTANSTGTASSIAQFIVAPSQLDFNVLSEFLAYKGYQGSLGDQLQDFLASKGYMNKTNPDMLYKYLGDNNFTGELTERYSKAIFSGWLWQQ